MAVVAGRGVNTGRSDRDNTSGAHGANVSQREDLANFISMITRDETPFMSSIGKTKATAIYHEWQTDQLASPGNSVIGEGTDYQFGASGTPGVTGGDTTAAVGPDFGNIGPHRSRLGNYTQINGKSIAISGTRRAIDQAGVADEYAYQLKKRGTELRRDLEHDLIHSFNRSGQTSGTGGTVGAARTFGGFQSWINQAISLESPDNDGGTSTRGGNVMYKGQFTAPTSNVANGNGVPQADADGVASSAATRGSLALSDIDEVMQSIYQNGGKAGKIMLSPKLRRDFSDLMVTDTGVRRNIDMDGKLRQSVDVYMSDFGDVMVVPNYIMGLSHNVNFANAGTGNATGNVNVADFSALMYDPMWFAIATLRPLQEIDVGQRGDSTIGMMIEECTLEVKNPQGCGAIYGLS